MDDEMVMLIDEWEDEKVLNKYHKLDIMKKISEFGEKYKLSMKVKKFTDIK